MAKSLLVPFRQLMPISLYLTSIYLRKLFPSTGSGKPGNYRDVLKSAIPSNSKVIINDLIIWSILQD